jgi:hypothetical protein
MSLHALGFVIRRVLRREEDDTVEQVLTQRPLHRVLAFTRRSIDDVVNSPIVKNEVRGFYKLYRQVERQSEITELERQWNFR